MHGKDHLSCKDKSEEEAIRDMLEANKAIEEKFSLSIIGNHFPGWRLSSNAAHVLKEAGLRYDATFTPTSPHFPPSGTKKIPEGFHLNSWDDYSSCHQTEFPMPAGKALGFHQAMLGGRPLLRFPTPKQLVEFLKRALNQTHPFVFYCHPFEFFDQNPVKHETLALRTLLFNNGKEAVYPTRGRIDPNPFGLGLLHHALKRNRGSAFKRQVVVRRVYSWPLWILSLIFLRTKTS